MGTVAGPKRRTPTSSGFVFHEATWKDYEAMLQIVGNRPIRVTFDRGMMELFRPSFEHGRDSSSLGRLVNILAEELELNFQGGLTTTHKRKDLEKGAEPDGCYWFEEKARHMSGKRQLDLNRDPAPDLVILVDLTRTSLDRLGIFAAMGVPETWQLTGRSLRFFRLQQDGTYRARPSSRMFPALSASSVARSLEETRTAKSTIWVPAFRAFVREKIVPGRGANGK